MSLCNIIRVKSWPLSQKSQNQCSLHSRAFLRLFYTLKAGIYIFFIFKSTLTDVGIEVWHCLRFFSWQPNSWYLTLISENGSKKKWGGNAFSTFVQTRVQFILGVFFLVMEFQCKLLSFKFSICKYSLTCVSVFIHVEKTRWRKVVFMFLAAHQFGRVEFWMFVLIWFFYCACLQETKAKILIFKIQHVQIDGLQRMSVINNFS